jgi:CheY-like chemotaxis protein
MHDDPLPVITSTPTTSTITPAHLAPTICAVRPGPARVLVADDCEPDRTLTIRHLGQAWPFGRDVVVECAANGREALEQLRQYRFALVVLDWNMPELGGRDVLRTMRADGILIPVVVVSGQCREAIAPDLEAMAAAFVHKDELNPVSFGSAIQVSLQLPGVQWNV